MAITHTTAVRNSFASHFASLVDTGTTNAGGQLVIFDGVTQLVAFVFNNPAFGAASSGTANLNGTPITATASATGMADSLEVQDRDATELLSGTVTATGGGGDAEIDNTSINDQQSVDLNSLSWTAQQ